MHCQVWSWLTQVVGRAEREPRHSQTVCAPGRGRGRQGLDSKQLFSVEL